MNLCIYTVGAISGLSYDDCVYEFNIRVKKLEAMGYDVLFPMLAKDYLKTETCLNPEGYKDHPIATNHAIVKTDFWRVDKADILFVDFTNAIDRVSIGSVAEMARGYSKDKLIITVMQKENIHRHAFITEMSSIIFETLDEAYAYFASYKDLIQNK